MKRKRLAIGIDDFKEVREKNCYFVDKTMFIDELVSKRYEATLILRPRRFGKTLNMSMLRYFFDIENREENRKLFDGLKIENTDKMEHQGKYPVIFLSFKDIKMKTWDDCKEKLKQLIKALFANMRQVREKLSEDEKIDFDKILFLEENGDYSGSLKNLSRYLYQYYGKKVVILIDEYDAPLITAHTEGYYEDAIYFFRNLLSEALKGNEYLEFGVMTGVLRMLKENIFSGLNNLVISTIIDNKYPYFGLTEDEVEELLQYYGLTYELPEVKEWYNGYRFGKQQVYNPWSIINFAANNELKSYWTNATFIKKILENAEKESFEKFQMLLEQKTIWQEIHENNNSIWTVLLFYGFLTYSEKSTSILKKEIFSLKIPNNELFSFFHNLKEQQQF